MEENEKNVFDAEPVNLGKAAKEPETADTARESDSVNAADGADAVNTMENAASTVNTMENVAGAVNTAANSTNTANTTNTTNTVNTARTGNTAQQSNYGSSSYSNYNYGSVGNTNSYGSYNYGNGQGNASGAYNGSSYTRGAAGYNAGANGYSQAGSSYTQGNASYAQTGSPYTTQTGTAYGQTGDNGGMPPKKKKNPFVTFMVLVLVVAIVCGVLAGGVWAVKNIDITPAPDNREIATTDPVDGAASSGEAATTTTGGTATAVVTDVTQVVQSVMPSIVAIDNNFTEDVNYYGYSMGEQEVTASGSGIIIGKNDTELLIVSNNHVVEGADVLKVQFIDGTKAEADIKGTNADMDLAVIAVQMSDLDDDTVNAIAIATLGDSDALQMGEPAIAIGNALGYGQSVTTGVVSATNRAVEMSDGSEGTFIQTDAAINPGNSGGALLNANGEVIGINSSKYASEEVEGMGFAIPISVAKPIIDELMNEETKVKADSENRGYLGVTVYTPTGVEGAYVASVGSGSAAEEAGIQAGDIITKLGDTEITSRDDLVNYLDYYEAGTTVSVTVLRKGASGYEEVELQVTLQSEKEAANSIGDSGAQSGENSQGGGEDFGF